jgi:hypothetical protein
MTDEPLIWPPSPELLAFRPERYELDSEVSVAHLRRDSDLPEWLVLPDGLDDEELAEMTVPACRLVVIELASTLGDVITVEAVKHPDGQWLIVVFDEYESEFRSPIETTTQPLTLGEMQRVLDETSEGEGEPEGVGHRWRELNELPDSNRADLVGFVTIRSALYPQLGELDRLRAQQWADVAR